MANLKLAACGVDCSICGLYNAGHDLGAAESCVEWFRGQGWIEADGDALAVQRAVRDKSPYCDGCWGDSEWCGCGKTDFRICCKSKGISDCGQCRDFPCEPYMEWAGWHENHMKAMENLLSLKQSRERGNK